MNKKEIKKIYKRNTIISILFIFLLSSITIGFASYEKILNTNGTLSLNTQGKVEIIDVELVNYVNVIAENTPKFDENNIELNLVFKKDANTSDQPFVATYSISIKNNTYYNYNFIDLPLDFTIVNKNGKELDKNTISAELGGIEEGDVIKKGETVTFSLTITFNPSDNGNGTYTLDGNIIPEIEEKPLGSILGAIVGNNVGDLTGNNTLAHFKVSIINSHQTKQQFSLNINNSHYKIVDENGLPIETLEIEAGKTEEYDIYIKKVEGSIFVSPSETTNIVLMVEGQKNTNCGKVTILVDYEEEYIDITPPQISEVTPTIENEIGTISLSWKGTDDVAISNYTILVYDDNNNLLDTIITSSDETNITITNIKEGNYYFKVYGIDQSGNKATIEDINNATESPGVCSKSVSANYKWVFKVTTDFENMKSSGLETVNLGQTYSATLSTSNWLQSLPENITVTMNGKTLTNKVEYTYTRNTGALKINNVNGDINIKGSATGGGICLVEGTKILLADGKTKNIEDIKYDDLLSVWSYDTGSLTYEYPIWIEKTNQTSTYLEITLSDKTTLKTVGHHGVFDVNQNKFVKIDKNIKIGSKIYKIENNKLIEKEVVDIKQVNEKVNYYHIISTRYYNIIANNILTTDGTVELSNLYGFDENVTWPKTRKDIIKNNLYKYEDLNEIPYYLFKGLRMEEAKYLDLTANITEEKFKEYARLNIINDKMLLPYPTKNGKKMFMVTTNINEKGKEYLVEENTYYMLPIKKDVSCYLNTTDYKCYLPGSLIKIETPIHFIEVKTTNN